MRHSRKPIAALATATLLTTANISVGNTAMAVPPETALLYEVLQEICNEARIQLVYSSSVSQGLEVKRPTPGQTLERSLNEVLNGTGLRFEYVNAYTVTIVKDKARRDNSATGPTPPSSRSTKANAVFESVVLTGTHLTGVEPVGVDLIRLTPSDVHNQAATVQDLIKDLPQNILGGPGEGFVVGPSNELEWMHNFSAAVGADLRGLTAGATLVLLDGRRLVPGASEGRFADLSMIPLEGLERIEVLPDGASAIYGADAVGGVINLIPRDHFQGAQASMRIGAVDGGMARERQVSQILGSHWNSGRSFVALQYRHRGSLPAGERAQSASSDLRSLGGSNFDEVGGNPGTILMGADTWAIPSGQDGRHLSRSDLQFGTANLLNRNLEQELLPQQDLVALIGTIRQNWSERTQLFADVLASERHIRISRPAVSWILSVPSSNPYYVDPTGSLNGDPVQVAYNFGQDFGPNINRVRSTLANITGGAISELGAKWEATMYATYSRAYERVHGSAYPDYEKTLEALANPDPEFAFNPFGDGSFTARETLDAIGDEPYANNLADLWAIHAMTQGEIGAIGQSPILMLIGVEGRYQKLHSDSGSQGSMPLYLLGQHRWVDALYGELRLPLVRRGNLSLAARHERYSDFGHATMPRAGLEWPVLPHFSAHATWSRSFKAPDLGNLDEASNGAFLIEFPDSQAPGGVSQVLALQGGSKDLKEATASTWTLGGVLHWAERNLSLGLTYFNTEFRDEVEQLGDYDGYLTDPRYRDIVFRNPTAAFRDEMCRRNPVSPDAITCRNAPISAILDLRLRNLARVRTSGLDFEASQNWATDLGRVDLDLQGTYALDFSEASTNALPYEQVLDTPGYPLRFRANASFGWTRGMWSASSRIRYSGSYRDRVADQSISAWTTADFQIRLNTGSSTVTLGMQNVFNTMPGFWNNPQGVGFDPANANLLGRYVSVELQRAW